MRFDRRISRRSFLAAAGVSAAALALTACGGSSSTAASTAASTGASSAAGTAAGGTLNIMLETEVQSLDPQIATDGTSFEVIADYTDGLMQMDADGAAVPAPFLGKIERHDRNILRNRNISIFFTLQTTIESPIDLLKQDITFTIHLNIIA